MKNYLKEMTKYDENINGDDIVAINKTLNLIDKLQKDNYELDRENQHYFDRIQDLQKEIESKNKQIKLMQEMNLPKEIEINYISKDIIKKLIEYLKELLGGE